MKKITLLNPESAQQIFINHGWTDDAKYFIHVESDSSEPMLNAVRFNENLSGNSLSFGFGNTFNIGLDEFTNETHLEIRDVEELGVLLLINQKPQFLRVFQTADESKIMQIGSQYPNLEIIDFGSEKNENIKDLKGILNCSNLHTLNLDNCPSLVDISGLTYLNKLTTLWLDGFADDSQFHFICTCTKLQILSQNYSQLLFPNHLAELTELTGLFLADCNIQDLSPLINLKNLSRLYLSKCQNIDDLSALRNLSSLTELTLSDCTKITTLSPISNFKELINLNISGCNNLRELSPLENLNALKSLNLSKCNKINDLTAISKLNTLIELDLSGCRKINDLTPLSGLSSLSYLNLSGCENLVELSPLSPICSLTFLDLSYNENITNLNSFSELRMLSDLNLFGCENLCDINSISELKLIRKLNLSYCQITDLNSLSSMSLLKHLELEGCDGLEKQLKPISELFEITFLNLSGCKKLCDLTPLSGLKNLSILNLGSCTKLTDLSPLSQLKKLISLNLCYCQNIDELAPISDFPALKELDLSGCDSLQILPEFSKLHSLTNLNLSDCQNLNELGEISNLCTLEELDLSFCGKIKELAKISGLSKLTKLNLAGIENLTTFPFLSGLISLTNLDLSSCGNLTRIKNIQHLTELKKIDLFDNPNIRDFEEISSLINLRELNWIDPVACNIVLMTASFNRKDISFIKVKISEWILELNLSKDSNGFAFNILNCLSCIESPDKIQFLLDLTDSMRSRGLQSEFKNDLDAYTWETWCNLALKLEKDDALSSLFAAVNELDIVREAEVLLGPVIVATSKMIEKYPEEKENLLNWVNEQLQLLEEHSEEQRQIAPSAAVFFAALNRKDDVLFWLQKATDEKAPLWRERVLKALVKHYAEHENFSEARRLLDEMVIQDEKDLAIASLAKAMAAKYPVEAGFLLHNIHEAGVSAEAARNLLSQPAMLREPQGIYQLLLHLQSNPEELAETLEKLIELDPEGKITDAVKQLFLQPQVTGPSASVLLELCKHPAIADFVKPRALEKYKNQLQAEVEIELAHSVPLLIARMQKDELLDEDEAQELTQLLSIQ
jgi:Leucine-rich repeat (LRR) protein